MSILRLAMFHQKDILREIGKAKFYAVLRCLWDKRYRRDIRHVGSLLKGDKLIRVRRRMPLCSIRQGHAINYQGWVTKLTKKMYDSLWYPPPIVVIYDWIKDDGTWVVVDGNHRLMAYKYSFTPGYEIVIIELVPQRKVTWEHLENYT